eukprot:COSAG04_NODE_524_length_13127_cov_18.191511_5_plen_171_part_00
MRRDLFGGPPSGLEVAAQVRTMLDPPPEGAQLASVPVTVPQNDTQVWEAKFDNRLPLDLHGADITAIEWYLTNQDGQRVNLQGNNFQITLRIGWLDPLVPPLGNTTDGPPGEHWMAVAMQPGKQPLLFDSFGRKPSASWQPHMRGVAITDPDHNQSIAATLCQTWFRPTS